MGLNRLKKLQERTAGSEAAGSSRSSGTNPFSAAKAQAAQTQTAEQAKAESAVQARNKAFAAQLPGAKNENKLPAASPKAAQTGGTSGGGKAAFSPAPYTAGSTTDSMVKAAVSKAQDTKSAAAQTAGTRTPKKQLDDAITGLVQQRHRVEESGTKTTLTEEERGEISAKLAELDKQISTLKKRETTLSEAQLYAGETELEKAARESKKLRQERNKAISGIAAGSVAALAATANRDKAADFEATNSVRRNFQKLAGANKKMKETGAAEYAPAGRVKNTIIGAAGQTAGSLLQGAAAAQDIATGGSRQSPVEDETWRQAFIDYLDANGGGKQPDPRKLASDALYSAAGNVMEGSALAIEKAKANAPKLGQLAVDTGVAGTQMLGDMAVTALTKVPSAGLASLAARAFGGSVYQAMGEGATAEEAAAYGLLSSAIEVMTEKVASTTLPFAKAYGRGTLDEAIERAVSRGAAKLAKTEKGRAAVELLMKTAASGGFEGMEEVLSDLLNPIAANLTYTSGQTADLEQTIEDFFVGAMLGLAGSGTQAILTAPEALRRGQARDTLRAAAEEAAAKTRQDADEAGAMENPLFTRAADGDETARRMLAAQRAGAALGENGARALRASYDAETAANLDEVQAFSGFAQVYNAALKGQKTDKAEAMALPEHMRIAAENAAKRDNARAAQAKYFGKDAGLVQDGETRRAKLTWKERQVLDSTAKVLGVQVKFAKTVAEGKANAQYRDGVITIARDADDPVRTAFLHEAVHRLREIAPEAYTALSGFVTETMGTGAEEFALQRRAALYRTTDISTISEETVADAFGRMLGDSEGMVRFARQNRNAVQRLLDTILDFIDRVRTALGREELRLTAEQKAEFRSLEGKLGEMQKTLETALKKAGDGKKVLHSQADSDKIGNIKKSLKDVTDEEAAALWKYKSSESYKVNAKLRDGLALTPEEQALVDGMDSALGKLPEYVGTVYRRLSFDMEGKAALDKFLAAHKEKTVIKNAAYTSSSTNIDGYIVTGKLTATQIISGKTGRDMSGIGNNDESEILFPRNTRFFVKEIKADAVGNPVLYMEEVINHGSGQLYSEEHSQTMQRLQTPEAADNNLQEIPGLDTGRSAGRRGLPGVRGEGRGEVKFSLKEDSQGRALTEAQQEFFQDSKIRDDDGNLLVVYHGTDADFTVFDRAKGRSNMDIQGSFFSPWDIDAGGYGGIVKAYYLNITNPASEGTAYRALNRFKGQNEAGIKAREYLQSLGYDGVNNEGEEYIAFSPEQIKLVDNENPTSDPDIRYSLKDTAESRELLKENRALEREKKALQDKVEYWKGQTKRTARVTTDKKAVAKAARELIRAYGAETDRGSVEERLQRLYDYMAAGEDGKDELTFTEAQRRAKEIARGIVETAAAEDDEIYRTYADLRAYLKKAGLVISQKDSHDVANFKERQSANRSRVPVKLGERSNVDQVYQELSALWPEFFDEETVSHPADQLTQILDVAEDVSRVMRFNPFSANMNQAADGIAAEILEGFFDLPQTRKTFADRQAEKLDTAKAKGKQAVAEEREKGKEKIAAARAKERARGREGIAREREKGKARLAQEREKNQARIDALREKNKERLSKVREQRDKKLEALNQKWQGRFDAAKEKQKEAAAKEREQRQERRKDRQTRKERIMLARILRHTDRMARRLTNPTDKKHIPESLRGVVTQVLQSINQESKISYNADGKRVKDGTGSPAKRTQAFLALKEKLQRAETEDGLVLDPMLFGDAAAEIQGSFDAVIAMQDTKLADMTMEQLQTVWKVLRAVEKAISTAGKNLALEKYARTKDWADAIQKTAAGRRGKRTSGRHYSLDLETPYTYFSHFGDAGMTFYRMLRDAQDKQMVMKTEVMEEAGKAAAESTVKRMEKETMTLKTEQGEKLTLTKAQAAEIYLLAKREQARDHLIKGGVIQPEIKGKKVQRGTEAIKLTADDLIRIKNLLSEEERGAADALQKLTTGTLAEYGNEASMKAYGYRKFTEKDYWPIRSAREGLHASVEKSVDADRSIKNVGMAQATIQHANNPLEIGGIFDTFARHTSDMIDYAAWLCPMEDASRLFNFRFRDEENHLTGETVKGLVERIGGANSQGYWLKLMRDIQNGIKGRNDSAFGAAAGRLYSNAKGAAVGANIRVIVQQPTAWTRAALVMNPADMTAGLVKGATRGNGWKKAVKWAPIAMRKAEGGFDISSPATMKESLFGGESALRKVTDAAGRGAAKTDEITWGKLWNACEHQVARSKANLELGSDDFYKEVARRFTEVIDQTQVVDGVLQRSQAMRSTNQLTQMATSFKGEPIMSMNMVMRAYDGWRYAKGAEGKKAGRKAVARAAVVYLFNAAINGLAQSMIDAIRDDDRDKTYWERFWGAYFGLKGDEAGAGEKIRAVLLDGNLISGMNPLSAIPYVGDIMSAAQGYSVERMDMSQVTDFLDAGKSFIQNIDGSGKKTPAYAIKQLFSAGAGVFGIPVRSLTRDIWAGVRTWANDTGNIPLQFELAKAVYNIQSKENAGEYYAILFQALKGGDYDSYKKIREELITKMGLPGPKVDSAMKSRYKKAAGADPAFTLPQEATDLFMTGSSTGGNAAGGKETRFDAGDLDGPAYSNYANRRETTYRETADMLGKYLQNKGIAEEEQNKAYSAAKSLAEDTALVAASGGKVTEDDLASWEKWAISGKSAGVDEAEAILFRLAYSMAESDKDQNGKTISGSKKENTLELVDDLMPWLTDDELRYLMDFYWSGT